MIFDKLKLQNKRTKIIKLPANVELNLAVSSTQDEEIDILIDTLYQLDELEPISLAFFRHSNADKMRLYLIYPKKNSPHYTITINRNELMSEAEKRGLDAFKLININEDFSCMGFKKYSNKISKKPSQCVNDYIDKIEFIRKDLSSKPQLLDFFNRLTFGYQKDWARFVYSAVKLETQEKRKEQMVQALSLGYKTIDLFKASK